MQQTTTAADWKFGVAMQNFTAYPEQPDAQKLIEYASHIEKIGYDSVWVWDHILLGTEPLFPIIDSLTLLTAIAARTSRLVIGTGILVLPLRNPTVLAKQLSSIDHVSQGRLTVGMASGWYKREFDACGIPFNQRGKLMDRNLEIIRRLWTEHQVTGEWGEFNLREATMYPKPYGAKPPQLLIGGYVDRVLKRTATVGDGWLTYFYTPEGFDKSWKKIIAFADEAGRDPAELTSANQLPIYVGPRDKIREQMLHWLKTEWDFAGWSDSTPDSAIMGTPEECVEQLQAHMEAGLEKIIFVPYRYEREQVEAIASDIIPKLRG
ncbi:MAG: TIGR03619 family F420-dependent LLM class oxidoreductase [Alphaproteobacteria bacterium]|nr:TIGR03619 family F420-dependent LLM class oxidoreductase [Alphaproteobacteria bacterium]